MGKDPSIIRAEIEETRTRVGDEVDALSYKTDVGARVGDYVDDKKEAVRSAVSSVVPDTTRIKRGARHMRTTAESNPFGLAVGGLAAGFIIGTLLPQTRVENERMGEISDRVLDTARETGREALEHGKEVAQEAVEAATETARAQGREHGEELASSLQERAQQVHGQEQSSESAQHREPLGRPGDQPQRPLSD